MLNPSTGYGTDPNANRVIEELASVLIDVEQRLQTVKFGLAQAFPHLAPAIQQRRMTPYGAELGALAGFPLAGAPQLAPGFAQFGAGSPVMAPSPYGFPPQLGPGVSPFGVGLGGFPSFRY